ALPGAGRPRGQAWAEWACRDCLTVWRSGESRGGAVTGLWFAIVCFMLTMFAVLEGWDFGGGAIHLLVARQPAERREVIAAIGPLWSWHEVWLVGAGGTFMVAFPAAMAAAFSGYYLAMWIALWSFMLRGISIEVGGHLADRQWQQFWDVVFAAANILLA